MKKKTFYHLILDQSGSMSNCIENTINGFNEQVQKINSLTAEFPDQEIRMGLTVFNNEVRHQFFDQPAGGVNLLDRRNYRPNGGTALYDAIGESIGYLRNTDDAELHTSFVVIVLTDGYENSSRMYSLGQVRTLISQLDETGRWTFSFLGATLDAVETAESMAFRKQNSMSFSKDEMNSAVWEKLNHSMSSYMDKKQKGEDLGNFL
jgi:hypothetical protein